VLLPTFSGLGGSRWNFDDMFSNFRDITTSGWLAVILDFRYEVASAIIAGDLYVSYIVINSCIVFGTACVSVKNSKAIDISVNLAAILNFWRTCTHVPRNRKYHH